MTKPNNTLREELDFASAFYGMWTPAAFNRDGGKFAKERGLFIVSAPHFNRTIESLFSDLYQQILSEVVTIYQKDDKNQDVPLNVVTELALKRIFTERGVK